jgi:squalene synthase HpnD
MAIPYPQALTEVKARVKHSRTSFHAGMNLLPKARREAMYALYAFCREVDDIADDGEDLAARRRDLQAWRERIAGLFRGASPDEPITAALAPAIKRFDLKEKDFQDIIDGMAMDAEAPIKAPDRKTLDLYCDRVASAVGRVSVRIFGDASEDAMRVSTHLGRAFQLTNILRDLSEDATRGRLYLPEELLAANGIAAREPNAVLHDPNLPNVCRDLAEQALTHFEAAEAAMQKCKPAAMRPARMMKAYYFAIFERLVAADWQDPTQRICLSTWDKMWIVMKNLVASC